RAAIYVEPTPMGDAPCPQCGTLLWFFDTANGTACCEFAAIAPLRDRLFAYVAANLGINIDEVVRAYMTREPLGFDSLDIVELAMELEEEFDLAIPLEHAKELKTFRDLIDYLVRLRL